MYKCILFSFVILLLCGSVCTRHDTNIAGQTYRMLDDVRNRKKEQLTRYLDMIQQKARDLSTDSFIYEFFKAKNEYYTAQKSGEPSAELSQAVENAKKVLQDYYLQKYSLFYDILFINREGDIFYTIRKQADYHKNIFNGELGQTQLSKKLRSDTSELFVDYSFYAISGEPSAFIVVPVLKNGQHIGWYGLQCAINKINSMFSQEQELGKTGEVFLVNREQYMLTDSRFRSGTAILKQHLSPANITAKFQERIGHKLVTDYRGYKALTSFEVCTVLGSEWLLIAKIDEDEVLTDNYRKNKSVLSETLINNLSQLPVSFCVPDTFQEKLCEVDMDEFRQSCDGELLQTHGVSTCTVVIISLPGQFSYLAHISPYDKIYGGSETDLVGHMLKRIIRFDIHEYEKRDLQITIVAPHMQSIGKLMEILVDKGFFLSQIKCMYLSGARYANVDHDYRSNRTIVQWKLQDSPADVVYQCASETSTLNNALMSILGYK